MAKQIFLIVFALAIGTAATFIFIHPSSKALAEQALHHVLQNDFTAAEERLRHLSRKKLLFPLDLYRSYVATARGDLHNSNLLLEHALNEAMQNQKEEVLAETLLAKAMNAYLEGKDHELLLFVEAGKNVSPGHPFIPLFEGLKHYHAGLYAEAMRAWSHFTPQESKKGSGWFAAIADLVFPPGWQQLHHAHCLLETGSIQKGRSILEKQSHIIAFQNQELDRLTTLFLGLSYLMEAVTIPLDERESYYKLASFYFDRGGRQEIFVREQETVIDHVKQEVSSLFLADSTSLHIAWGLDLIRTLQQWEATEALDTLAASLALGILKQKKEESLVLCQSIRKDFQGTAFHLLLTEKLMFAIKQNMKEQGVNKPLNQWILVEALSSSTEDIMKQMANFLQNEIVEMVKNDNELLHHTRHSLTFWKKLKRDDHERHSLATQLLFQAKLLWKTAGKEKKGEQLMELVVSLSEAHPTILDEIETFLLDLYQQAEGCHLIERLTLIYDAMERFHITRQELLYPSKLANYLADAQYLYYAHNYAQAKTHAAWILKLDPRNEQALRLAGLSSFYLGEYKEAISFLQKLSDPDPYVNKALTISQVFSTHEPTKHLAQIDSFNSFEEDE